MSDEWYTPKWVFDSLGVEFDLDVAHPAFDTDVPCKRYYTIDDDSLNKEWDGFVWMNPPYSKPTPFIDRFIEHNNGIALVPFSKSKWFGRLWNEASGLVALPPNLKFVRPDGTHKQIFMQCVLASMGNYAKDVLIKAGIGTVR